MKTTDPEAMQKMYSEAESALQANSLQSVGSNPRITLQNAMTAFDQAKADHPGQPEKWYSAFDALEAALGVYRSAVAGLFM